MAFDGLVDQVMFYLSREQCGWVLGSGADTGGRWTVKAKDGDWP
jgi:hypothetical protein